MSFEQALGTGAGLGAIFGFIVGVLIMAALRGGKDGEILGAHLDEEETKEVDPRRSPRPGLGSARERARLIPDEPTRAKKSRLIGPDRERRGR